MKKILVIEDAQSLRRDIIEMLSFEGYDVSGAEDGRAGVERARQILPDLIICDIMMPQLDGYGVLEELRRDPVTAAIPFIFLTARTDRTDIRQGMELGADDYLTKPFTASELLRTVDTRLQKAAVIAEHSGQQMERLRENIILALPHELRTPLNVILGFSDLLMSDYEVMEPSRMGEMARHINSAALRLYRLIENFLIYANIKILETSPEQIEEVRRSVIRQPKTTVEYVVVNKAQQLGREDDVRLNVQDVEAVQVAEENLRKILEELVDNAAKFSEPGTPISVETRLEKNYYTICISDQGRGMTAEQIASVGAYMQFERRFYEQQGSGLGLIIAKRLAELHDGDLGLSSVPAQGTTISVRFPLRSNGTAS